MKKFLLPLCVCLMVCGSALAADADAEVVRRSAAKAVETYPDCGVKGSPLSKAIETERIRRLQVIPTFFENPDWPMILATMIVNRLDIKPGRRVAKAQAQAPTVPTPDVPKFEPVPRNAFAAEHALRNDPEALAAYRAQKAREAELRALEDIAEELRRIEHKQR